MSVEAYEKLKKEYDHATKEEKLEAAIKIYRDLIFSKGLFNFI